MVREQWVKEGLLAGFSRVAILDCRTIEVRPEVREMCSSGMCRKYGTSWTCPPACGTLEFCEKEIRPYKWGLLVQTIGELEDEFDGEGMMETEKRHKESFWRLLKKLQEEYPKLLALGTGCCTICDSCTYPDEPCRFPQKAVASVEAYGIVVRDLCLANGLEYYYGPNRIAYTGCYLLEVQ